MRPLQLGYPHTALRRELVEAVLRGEKTATAGLPDEDDPMPAVGERLLLHDLDDQPLGVVEVTEARVVPVADVDEQFARDEGEGFESVADWRRAHELFFGRSLSDDEPVELTRFRLTDLFVAPRYRGPTRSGNGGYTSGLVASLLGGSDVEVTLRIPPPLETPLRIDGSAVYAGDALVAEARRAPVELDLPPPPAVVEAGPADPDHPFPGCFTCGPGRDDGLGLLPRAYGDLVAAPWRPRHPSREHVWAALDCPGAFAVALTGSAGGKAADARPEDTAFGGGAFERGITVLGRLAAHVEHVPADGEELVVVAWPLPGGDERRSYAGTCLFRGTEPLAWARATWFAVGDEFRDPLPSPA